MFKFLRGITKKKILIVGLSIVLGAVMALSGVTVTDRLAPESDSLFQVGMGQKVITIGHIAYAAGTADYTADGVADDVQFQAALNALPAAGGKISVLTGNYVFSATVTRAIANVTIEGNGLSTNFTYDGVTPIFMAGGDRWVFANFVTDAGSINLGATTGWEERNVLLGATYYAYRNPAGQSVLNDVTVASLTDSGLTNGRIPIVGVGGLLGDSANLTWSATTFVTTTANITTLNAPTGRGATLVVAASDASAAEIAQADYVVSGTADDEIQAAIDAAKALAGGGGIVHLSSGNFSIGARITLQDRVILEGSGWGTILTLANGVNDIMFYANNEIQTIIIRDMELDGNKANQVLGFGSGIMLESTAYVSLTNLRIRNMFQDAVSLHRGVALYNNVVLFKNVALTEPGRFGVYAIGLSGATFENTVVEGATSAFRLDGTGADNPVYVFINPWMEGNDIDINANAGVESIVVIGGYLDGTSNTIVTDNTVQNVTVVGGIWMRAPSIDAATRFISSGISGYVTTNSGVAILLNGNNAVNVNHGLATNATAIWLTSTNNETGLLYVTSENVTSFTINSSNNVTANRNVYWRAVVRAGN